MRKDIKGKFPYINTLPSGLIIVIRVADWFSAGAVVVSGWGTDPSANNNHRVVTKNAKKYVSVINFSGFVVKVCIHNL